MNPYKKIRTDYIDTNGVQHIDAWKTIEEDKEGETIGYIFNGKIYWRNTEYNFISGLKEMVYESLQKRSEVLVQGIYRHYKGNYYQILNIARSSDNPNLKLVVYKALYINPSFDEKELIWVRPLEEFLKPTQKGQQRFILVQKTN